MCSLQLAAALLQQQIAADRSMQQEHGFASVASPRPARNNSLPSRLSREEGRFCELKQKLTDSEETIRSLERAGLQLAAKLALAEQACREAKAEGERQVQQLLQKQKIRSLQKRLAKAKRRAPSEGAKGEAKREAKEVEGDEAGKASTGRMTPTSPAHVDENESPQDHGVTVNMENNDNEDEAADQPPKPENKDKEDEAEAQPPRPENKDKEDEAAAQPPKPQKIPGKKNGKQKEKEKAGKASSKKKLKARDAKKKAKDKKSHKVAMKKKYKKKRRSSSSSTSSS